MPCLRENIRAKVSRDQRTSGRARRNGFDSCAGGYWGKLVTKSAGMAAGDMRTTKSVRELLESVLAVLRESDAG